MNRVCYYYIITIIIIIIIIINSLSITITFEPIPAGIMQQPTEQ